MTVPDQIASFDVPIGEDSWIHEIRCGFNNKDDIVLLHGYGGFALTYVRLFEKLSLKYRVHALDFLGMGLSHRREFKKDWNHEEAINYFVDAIEAWRIASGIKTFVLAGHSFGAYLAMCYSKKYPKSVERLLLISPPGVIYMDERISEQLYNQMREQSSCGRKIFLSLAKTLINRGTTPSDVVNWPFVGNMIINRIVEQRLKLEKEEKDAWCAYYKAISKISTNSELAFFKIFMFPRFGARDSIERILTENKFPFKVEFYFGDTDWMEKQTASELP